MSESLNLYIEKWVSEVLKPQHVGRLCKQWPSCSCGYSNGRKRQADCSRTKATEQEGGERE